MKITELQKKIFPDIREYAQTPLLNVFISECNLSCIHCPVTESLGTGKKVMLNTLLENIGREFEKDAELPDVVVISGGEPLMFFETAILCSALLSMGKKVYLKTNGTGDLRNIPAEVIKLVYFKLISSGEAGEFFFENLAVLSPDDVLVFKIFSTEDMDFAFRLLVNLDMNAVKFRFIFRLMDGILSQDQIEESFRLHFDKSQLPRPEYDILI